MPVQPASFKRCRLPPDVIRLAVWLYFRFTLRFREVEEIRAPRGMTSISAKPTGPIPRLIRCQGPAKFGEPVERRRKPRKLGKWNRLTCERFNGWRLIRRRIHRSFFSPPDSNPASILLRR
jgi:hypothetical protein